MSPAGAAPQRTRLSIGGLGLSLTSSDVTLDLSGAAARFEAEPRIIDCELDVRLGDIGDHHEETVFNSHGVWVLTRSDSHVTFRCTSEVFGVQPYKIARLLPDFSRGTIVMNARYFDRQTALNPLGYPLDELLITNLLAFCGGAELHGCGAIDGKGRGMVFVGQSGAGKSTTGLLLEAAKVATVISDDRVIVRDLNERLTIYGTPWHGDAEYSLAASAPLGGVFFLEQATDNAILDISQSDAVARLMTCSFPPFHDPSAVASTLALFDRVAAEVPCRVLRFRPDQTAVRLLESAW